MPDTEGSARQRDCGDNDRQGAGFPFGALWHVLKRSSSMLSIYSHNLKESELQKHGPV